MKGLPVHPPSSAVNNGADDLDEIDALGLVSKELSIQEAMNIPAARDARQKKWGKLKSLGCWDVRSFREYDDVVAEAQASKKIVHFGRISPVCHEKHSELGPDKRKYKGRVVFQGNNVKDQDNNWAVFQEMQSSASLMSASKFVDYWGSLDGHVA